MRRFCLTGALSIALCAAVEANCGNSVLVQTGGQHFARSDDWHKHAVFSVWPGGDVVERSVSGTATLIDDRGYFLTAYHVVATSIDSGVVLESENFSEDFGDPLNASVVLAIPESDIALLVADPERWEGARPFAGRGAVPLIGLSVAATATGYYFGYGEYQGKESATQNFSLNKNKDGVLDVSGENFAGDSGSLLIDKSSGAGIGVLSRRDIEMLKIELFQIKNDPEVRILIDDWGRKIKEAARYSASPVRQFVISAISGSHTLQGWRLELSPPAEALLKLVENKASDPELLHAYKLIVGSSILDVTLLFASISDVLNEIGGEWADQFRSGNVWLSLNQKLIGFCFTSAVVEQYAKSSTFGSPASVEDNPDSRQLGSNLVGEKLYETVLSVGPGAPSYAVEAAMLSMVAEAAELGSAESNVPQDYRNKTLQWLDMVAMTKVDDLVAARSFDFDAPGSNEPGDGTEERSERVAVVDTIENRRSGELVGFLNRHANCAVGTRWCADFNSSYPAAVEASIDPDIQLAARYLTNFTYPWDRALSNDVPGELSLALIPWSNDAKTQDSPEGEETLFVDRISVEGDQNEVLDFLQAVKTDPDFDWNSLVETANTRGTFFDQSVVPPPITAGSGFERYLQGIDVRLQPTIEELPASFGFDSLRESEGMWRR